MIEKKTTIVFMGDSITEGQYVEHALRWTDLVAARALKEMPDRVLHFHNRGISGETTRQGLERFPRDVQEMHPDVMTLQFGLNDCNHWDTDKGLPRVSEAAYRANMIEMIARARNFGAREIILSTNHVTLRTMPLSSGKSLEEHRKRYNEIVREIAKETGVTFCEMEAHFMGFNSAELAEMLLPEPDLLHLSPKGHAYYADIIYPYIKKAIG